MLKLYVENFQSIKKLEVELNGLCMIYGETASGKSAIRRALEFVLYNYWSDSYRRQGVTKVTLQGEGFTITREKGGRINSLTIKIGEEVYLFGKVGRSYDKPIQDILDKLGFKKLTTIDKSYPIQVAKQMMLEPAFMVTFSHTENTKILNAIFNISQYEKAKKLAKSEKTSLQKEIKILQNQNDELISDISKLKEELQHLKKLHSPLKKIKLLKQFQTLYTLRKQYSRMLSTLTATLEIYRKRKLLIQLSHLYQEKDTLAKTEAILFKKLKLLQLAHQQALLKKAQQLTITKQFIPLLEKYYTIKKMQLLNKGYTQATKELKKLKAQKDSLLEVLHSLKVCPCCKQVIKEENDATSH